MSRFYSYAYDNIKSGRERQLWISLWVLFVTLEAPVHGPTCFLREKWALVLCSVVLFGFLSLTHAVTESQLSL